MTKNQLNNSDYYIYILHTLKKAHRKKISLKMTKINSLYRIYI